jgi:hypothetical protein
MNIIERNLFRLLRAGAFNTQEQIEPLSAWKWRRLYQLSEMHDVAPFTYQGLERCKEQFLVQVPADLMQQWGVAKNHGDDEDNELLAANRLTNPVLNHQLQNILDDEHSNTETRTALLHLLGIARFIMNAGIPVKRVTELGQFLRLSANRTDFTTLQQWINKLQLQPMTQLACVMLVKLMHFDPAELPFMQPMTDDQMERQLNEMLRQKNSHAEEWYFSQGKDIFVHTSNSSAMLWHVRRSAKYFRYYPSETMTNFITAFAHSLSHIEE